MRFFEILLLITLFPPLLFAFLPRKRPLWIHALSLIAPVILLLHTLLEEQRWQMWPAYLLTIILAVAAGWQLAQRRKPTTPRRALAVTGGIVGFLLWGVALFLSIALPVPTLGEPGGPYAVGTTIMHLVDENRLETYTADPNDNRELIAQVWYPASEEDEVSRALYLPGLAQIGPVVADRFELPAFLFNHINLTELEIYNDVPVTPDDTSLPVIIFSHGLGGLRTQNTAMFQELASHGYVVAAVDHAYANAISIFPDGRVVLYDEDLVFPTNEPRYVQANGLLNIWAADIAFLLDELEQLDGSEGLFLGRINTEQVGVFGHSTGGGTAVEFCLIDDRCTAGVGLDSWVLPVSQDRLADGLTQPFMFISTPEWLGPDNRARGLEIFNGLQGDGYNIAIADTGHYDFSDLVLLSPFTPQLGLSGTINSAYSIGIQNEYILAFFDQYLKGEERELLKRPSPYSELQIERR